MPARILIIEDHPANLDLMTYLLRAFGHDPITAPDGEQGLAVARRENPDLIVCDIQLPGIDGHAVARAAKAEPALRTIPLVAVTAFAMVGDRDRVLASGFDAYISKPIDPETFLPHIEAFLPPNQRSGRVAFAISPSANRGTILVVDGESVNPGLERSILEPLGYVVNTAGGMAEALQLAHEIPPDVILSDLSMPGGSGFDFIRAVKADGTLKDVPFIFVASTHSNENARARGLALGAARFLFRPVEPQALVAEIETCVAERKRA